MAPQGNRMGQSDPTSYSEPEKCAMKKLHLNVKIDFNSHTVGGVASLYFENKKEALDELFLDARGLQIESVTLQEENVSLSFTIDNPCNVDFGDRLCIQLPKVQSKNFTVDIEYRTSQNSTALDWLTPQQTAGKRHPYVYSQCQAIHARSLYPCQDTPAVRFTYTAQVEAPKEITVLMSANRGEVVAAEGSPGHNVTSFSQDIPIPSYLLAIVAGDLESRDIGPRSKVWCERESVDAAAFEFAETESMLQAAEDLMGPYVWGQYDLLVLPPSFPYGGMENPCLTFVTPTLLAGDRSLVGVVAHEISHSWTGNLVTNANFEHFWLNEGHTVFFERKILGRLYGEPRRQLHAHSGWLELTNTIDEMMGRGEAAYTKLVPELVGVDPDEAFSTVPYEKGYALLQHLETLLGGPDVFNKFLRAYLEEFKYQSILTQDWKDFLLNFFNSPGDQAKLAAVDWDKWLHSEGVPPFQPDYDLSEAQASQVLSQRWIQAEGKDLDGFSEDDIQGMISAVVEDFLTRLFEAQPAIPVSKVQRLEEVYQFQAIKNSEIRLKWLKLCIKARWTDAVQNALNFVNEQGRMKFVIPIYEALSKWEEVRPRALDNFEQHRAEMHSTTARKVEKLFNP